jgi:hypothetical protein
MVPPAQALGINAGETHADPSAKRTRVRPNTGTPDHRGGLTCRPRVLAFCCTVRRLVPGVRLDLWRSLRARERGGAAPVPYRSLGTAHGLGSSGWRWFLSHVAVVV